MLHNQKAQPNRLCLLFFLLESKKRAAGLLSGGLEGSDLHYPRPLGLQGGRRAIAARNTGDVVFRDVAIRSEDARSVARARS